MERLWSLLVTVAILQCVQELAAATDGGNCTCSWSSTGTAVVTLLVIMMCTETAAFIAVCILCYKKKYVLKKLGACFHTLELQTRTRQSISSAAVPSEAKPIWRMDSDSSHATLASSVGTPPRRGSKLLTVDEEGKVGGGQRRNSILLAGGSNTANCQPTYEALDSAPQSQEPRDYEQEVKGGGNEIYWEPPDDPAEIQLQMSVRGYPVIPASELMLLGKLGEGEFGDVFKGEMRSTEGVKMVAVKSLKAGADYSERVKLLKEAAIMGQFRHPNVVQFFGVRQMNNNTGEVMLVMEFLPGGDLRDHLVKLREMTIKQPLALKLLHFCQEIAGALTFLHNKDFVHRDLAARNILLSQEGTCKLADFGMSHEMGDDYYYKPKGGMIPVKWTAPEAILYKRYTTKSDVWSYGMVVYEIWSLGRKPFEDFSVDQLVQMLSADSGYCQPPPPGCPREIYRIMVDCWNPSFHCRPAMSMVYRKLGDERGVLEGMGQTGERLLGSSLEEGYGLHPDLQRRYNTSSSEQQQQGESGATGVKQPTYLNDPGNGKLDEGHKLHSDLQRKYNMSSSEQQQQWEGGAASFNQPTYLNDPANTEPIYGNI